jgi:hypothetical protein
VFGGCSRRLALSESYGGEQHRCQAKHLAHCRSRYFESIGYK